MFFCFVLVGLFVVFKSDIVFIQTVLILELKTSVLLRLSRSGLYLTS